MATTGTKTTVTMPQLGESIVEGEIGDWMVQEGQRVEHNQPLVTILTDKTDTDIPAPVGGVVVRLLVETGQMVEVGTALCEIDPSAEASASAPSAEVTLAVPDPPAVVDPPAATPSVRKLAREKDVDLNYLAGSGEGGRITREDVLSAASPAQPPASRPALAPPRQAKPSAQPSSGGTMRVDPGSFRIPPFTAAPGDEIIPFSRRRRIIADHMVYSKLTSPHVVTFAETDIHRTATLRNAHKGELRGEGISLSYLAFVVAATCRALRENRAMNSRVLDGEHALIKAINIGLAVETPKGLVVPVIKHADELSVRGIARAIGELATRARNGDLTPDDLSGKTFTISNPGRQGNLVGGAIISQPNVGILRMGEIKKRVVVIEHEGVDTMAIHPVMFMALSYDHRVVDGVAANGFLYRVHELLQLGDFEI